ncbi:hypothetical protein QOT17_016469 [Balamuthia mandrillaris]
MASTVRPMPVLFVGYDYVEKRGYKKRDSAQFISTSPPVELFTTAITTAGPQPQLSFSKTTSCSKGNNTETAAPTTETTTTAVAAGERIRRLSWATLNRMLEAVALGFDKMEKNKDPTDLQAWYMLGDDEDDTDQFGE